MRKIVFSVLVLMLVALPSVGIVQQAPQEPKRGAAAISELQQLVAVQTQAIQALRASIVDLEARIKRLESARDAGDTP
jgi:cell division protein FtsB